MRLVFHTPHLLAPQRASGDLRTLRLCAELRRRGAALLFVAPAGRHDASLHALGLSTCAAADAGGAEFAALAREFQPDAVVFVHAVSEHRFGRFYAEQLPATVRLFDTVDLNFVREARRRGVAAGAAAGGTTGAAALPSADRLDTDGLDEWQSMLRSDATLVVSDFERTLLVERFHLSAQRVARVSNVHEPEARTAPFEARRGFAFLGGFQHAPNVDAVAWMAAEVWPLIRAALPGATWTIAGADAPEAIRRLHDPGAGVTVAGFVADHRALLGAARVLLSPLRFGAGVKGKIGEALACGTPVVTNAIGAEGMDAAGRVLALAETPAELARCAAALHEDRAEWGRRSAAGAALLERDYSAAANVTALLDAMARVATPDARTDAHAQRARLLWHVGRAGGGGADVEATKTARAALAEARAVIAEQQRALAALAAENERVRASLRRGGRAEAGHDAV
ncbi:MAG: glycosyltransferase family 4 protein [Phycisphaerae bacterium]